jgi:small subunit ribosomal protein S27Ae
MQIFVKTLGRTLALDVQPSTSIEQIKALVEAAEGIPACRQNLVTDKLLEEGATLADFGIVEEATINMVLAVDGGKKKKKKKKIFKGPKKPDSPPQERADARPEVLQG